MPRSAFRSISAVLVAGALALGAAGCTAEAEPKPTKSSSPAPSITGTPVPAPEPALIPDGTAEENLPYFTAIVAEVWASEGRDKGRSYTDALAEAGFDKSAMQVTADQTTVGRHVESMLFSVRWGEDECLIGQVGPSTGDPVTTVTDQLAEGRCLVGETRPVE